MSSNDIYERLLRIRTFSEKLQKIPLFGPSLIQLLRLLASQQHQESGVLLTLFSMWGTENSLAEIENLEITLGNKRMYFATLWADVLSCNKKHSREQNAAARTV